MNASRAVLATVLLFLASPVGRPGITAGTDPVAAAGQPMASKPRCEHLWVSHEDWQARREAVLASPLLRLAEDAARVLQETADVELAAFRTSPGDLRDAALLRLKALTVRAACYDDGEAAREAEAWIHALLGDTGRSDLGRASTAVNCVVAYAFCHPFWSDALRREVEAALLAYGRGFQTIGRGNPDNPFNNWWGVTHSAAGLCLLAGRDTDSRAAHELAVESDAVASYLLNYGESGHYYEGTGYGLYASAFWMPFRLAVEATEGFDIARHGSGALEMPLAVCSLTVPGVANTEQSEPASPAIRPFWNDDGGHFVAADLASLFCATNTGSVDAVHAALHKIYDEGQSDSLYRIDHGHGHPMWTLLYYPLGEPRLAYGEGLPLRWIDRRTGLAVFRNQYATADDIVCAAYAKAYHGGGHVHHDAGSFRLVGLGASWAHAGGQAKPEPQYQNVLLRNGTQLRDGINARKALGRVIYFAEHGAGGAVSLDLSDVYGVGRVRRHFAIAYHPLPDVDAVVAVFDEIMDRDSDRANWAWSLCFDRELDVTLLPHKNAFELRMRDGAASFRATFDSVRPLAYSSHHGPPSERRFSEGRQQSYPGARYVLVSDHNSTRPGFFTVMTLQSGPPPPVRFAGDEDNRRAIVGDGVEVRLDRSKWFQGPLRIVRRVGENG